MRNSQKIINANNSVNNESRKNKPYLFSIMIIGIVVIFSNVLFINHQLATLYTLYIYHPLSDAASRIMSIVPFSMGEILLYVITGMTLVYIISMILWIVFRKRTGYQNYVKTFSKGVGMTVAIVLLIYTFWWMIPFHNDMTGIDNVGRHNVEEIAALREEIVVNMNRIADIIERDEEGHVIYPEDVTEINDLVNEAMVALGDEFPALNGYYPYMKPAMCSDFLEWMSIAGYTYPYTMEITYNRYEMEMYYPFLAGHELSHHKGFYKESEANLISYLACTRSEDLRLQYAAYFYMYSHVDDAYYESLCAVMPKELAKQEYKKRVRLSQQVIDDEWYSYDKSEAYYAENVNQKLEGLSEYAEEVAEVGWDAQAEILQEANYDGVVDLLIEYYNK